MVEGKLGRLEGGMKQYVGFTKCCTIEIVSKVWKISRKNGLHGVSCIFDFRRFEFCNFRVVSRVVG